MYSVVLLAALTGGVETPDCHKAACTGSCTGYVATTCSGCTGGHKLFGGGLFNKHSCHGSCSGSCTGYVACTGGYAPCSGGYAPCSGGYMPGCGGMIVVPEGKKPEEIKKMPGTDKPKEEVRVPTPATIVVELPSDAKLTIDNGATAATSTVRTFITPELTPAKTFSYVLKAQIVRDGQTLTAEQKINVEAGVETRVNLGMDKFTALTVAAK